MKGPTVTALPANLPTASGCGPFQSHPRVHVWVGLWLVWAGLGVISGCVLERNVLHRWTDNIMVSDSLAPKGTPRVHDVDSASCFPAGKSGCAWARARPSNTGRQRRAAVSAVATKGPQQGFKGWKHAKQNEGGVQHRPGCWAYFGTLSGSNVTP